MSFYWTKEGKRKSREKERKRDRISNNVCHLAGLKGWLGGFPQLL
jgi:hypothetical protein